MVRQQYRHRRSKKSGAETPRGRAGTSPDYGRYPPNHCRSGSERSSALREPSGRRPKWSPFCSAVVGTFSAALDSRASFRFCRRFRTTQRCLGLNRLRAECPGRVALRPVRAGERALPREFPDALLLILRARQRGEEGDNVIDLRFAQGQGLHVLIEPRILDAVTLVVMVHHVPQRGLRAVVKVRCRNQDITQAWCLEGCDISRFFGD